MSPVRVGFSVPKKKFRHAVQRNRMKRLMRESWRLHKHSLYASMPAQQHVLLFLIFTDSTITDYEVVHTAMVKGIERLATIAATLSDNNA